MYTILQESNVDEGESWLYFIKYEGNEEAIAHLQEQLSSIRWYNYDNLSCFEFETTALVSETTAREMTQIDLNSCSRHRKFDGTLQKIDFGLQNVKNSDSKNKINKKKIKLVNKQLCMGGIANFIDKEEEPDYNIHIIDEEEDEDASTASGDESDPGSFYTSDEEELNTSHECGR